MVQRHRIGIYQCFKCSVDGACTGKPTKGDTRRGAVNERQRTRLVRIVALGIVGLFVLTGVAALFY